MQTRREREQQEQTRVDRAEFSLLRRQYQTAFGSTAGRLVLGDMLRRAHAYEPVTTGNAWSHFNDGERNGTLRIASYIPGIVGEVIRDHYQALEEEILRAERNDTDG